MKNISEQIFSDPNSTTVTYDSGNNTYIGSGKFIKQYTGLLASDNYISPFKISVGRPMEASLAISSSYPWIYSFSDTIDWVFMCEVSTAAVSRRIVLYEYNKNLNIFSWKGYITFNTAGATTNTIRGFRMGYYKYNTGTVDVSGTGVTGNSTLWSDSRFANGARIGFGSTDPTQITTWYNISTINSNTGITLSTDSGLSITSQPYVIEELRVYVTVANSAPTTGGLWILKGLNYNDFSPTGTAIPVATTIDNQKAWYMLSDASTLTMLYPWGLSVDDDSMNFQSKDAYVVAGTTAANGYNIYKYNLRAELTSIVGGKTTSAFLLKTGNIPIPLLGSIIITNNGRLATLNHGAAIGQKSIFFVTTTRIYRCPISQITNGNTTYMSDNMVDIPPGGLVTYLPTSFSAIESCTITDMLITSGAAANRCYVTKYYTDSTPADIIFLSNDWQYDQSSADSTAPIHPTTNNTIMSFSINNGYLYAVRGGTLATTNQIYCIPYLAHRRWADDVGETFITKKISTNGCLKFYRMYINSNKQAGSSTFGVPTEDFDVSYRTTGFENISGGWTDINYSGDLSGVSGSDYIQFKIKFKVLGTSCIASRIYSIAVSYEDSGTDSHYTPSVNKSSVTNRTFAYRQSSSWGSDIPNLNIKLYNATTGNIVLDDDIINSSNGVWKYSTDGVVWNTWNITADNVGNYISYTATTLPDSIIVRALLTQ